MRQLESLGERRPWPGHNVGQCEFVQQIMLPILRWNTASYARRPRSDLHIGDCWITGSPSPSCVVCLCTSICMPRNSAQGRRIAARRSKQKEAIGFSASLIEKYVGGCQGRWEVANPRFIHHRLRGRTVAGKQCSSGYAPSLKAKPSR